MSNSMSELLKELSKQNMKNFIVGVIAVVWFVAFSYSIFNYKEITESQSFSLSKLDTLITLIVGYYLKTDKRNEQ